MAKAIISAFSATPSYGRGSQISPGERRHNQARPTADYPTAGTKVDKGRDSRDHPTAEYSIPTKGVTTVVQEVRMRLIFLCR